MSLLYSASRLLLSGITGVVTGWDVRGRENIPRTGGLIVASNHISFVDPPIVGVAAIREMHYLGKQELFHGPFGLLLRTFNGIPIRRGMADLSGLTRAMDVLRAGKALVMFPEGGRKRDGELHPARPGVGMLAVNTDATIVPAYIFGSDRPGKWLTRGVRLRVWFGPARSWQELAGSKADLEPGRELYQAIGEGTMREIAALKAGQTTSATR